jgi:hypothetical protein
VRPEESKIAKAICVKEVSLKRPTLGMVGMSKKLDGLKEVVREI